MSSAAFRATPNLPASADVTSERQVIDIFLAPGEFYFGDQDTRIRTVLGSCVAITLWHPLRLIGGMCHFMLPTRGHKPGADLDGRYGDEAVQLFLKELKRTRSAPGEYEVKLFGGGNMFPDRGRHHALHVQVGRRNVDSGLQWLQHHRFRIKAQHMEGNGHRNIVFELWSGDVWLRHVEPPSGK